MVMLLRPSVRRSDTAGMMKYSSNADRCQLLRSVFAFCQSKMKNKEAPKTNNSLKCTFT